MSSTETTPHQALLSTIYKQSWHPVASTKYVINRGLNRPKEVALLTKTVIKNPKSRYASACLNHESLQSRKTVQLYKKVPYSNSPQIPRETSFTLFTTSSNNSSVHAPTSQSSLSNWKRQLKTCVDSNSRNDTAGKSNQKTSPDIDCGKTLKERLLSARYKQSCASDSSNKSYKILNYQNSTLASICVQGKDPPTKSRSFFRPRNGSTGSYFSTTSESTPVACQSEVGHKTSNSRSKPQNAESSSLLSRRYSSSTMETEPITTEDENAINDDVFDRNNDDLNLKEFFGNSDFDEMPSKDDYIPNLDLMTFNFSLESDESDSDNESNSSDPELSSDEEDQREPLLLQPKSDEDSKLYIEKCKQLYKNENHAFISDLVNNCNNEIGEDDTLNFETAEEDADLELQDHAVKYEFAEVFPKPFEKYSLKELSLIPHDVNWRNIVKFSELISSNNRSTSKKSYVARQRHARSARVIQERNRLENLIDRLLTMEKLQISTKRSELMNRYHIAHVRAAVAKQKNQNNKTMTSSNTSPVQKSNDSNNEPVLNQRSPTRRRSSTSISSARLAWANEISKGEQNILKEANQSGDFSAVLDDWSFKNRPNKSPNDRGRRSSDSARSVKRPRSRYSQSHPRFYEYNWSERSKDDRNRTWIIGGSKSRSCPTCREKWRKLTATLIQERKQRPRTASVSSAPVSRFHGGTINRPLTQQTSRSIGQALSMTLNMTSSPNNHRLQSKRVPPQTPPPCQEETTRRNESSTRTLCKPEDGARTQQRSNFIVPAFKISSVSLNKRF